MIVAAESVYADVARALVGPDRPVMALISNPAADPHLFEVGPDAARAVSAAKIILYNGAGYDPWMRDLLAATAGSTSRRVIDVADLAHVGPGANPHLWYDPAVIDALAVALCAALVSSDPDRATSYTRRLAEFRQSLAPIHATVVLMRQKHPGALIAATEPVFGPMLAALGFHSVDPAVAIAVQNDTEPPAASFGALLDSLRSHRAAALIVNIQTVTDLTRQAEATARRAGVPIVAITESEPADMSYSAWVGGELRSLSDALDHRP